MIANDIKFRSLSQLRHDVKYHNRKMEQHAAARETAEAEIMRRAERDGIKAIDEVITQGEEA